MLFQMHISWPETQSRMPVGYFWKLRARLDSKVDCRSTQGLSIQFIFNAPQLPWSREGPQPTQAAEQSPLSKHGRAAKALEARQP